MLYNTILDTKANRLHHTTITADQCRPTSHSCSTTTFEVDTQRTHLIIANAEVNKTSLQAGVVESLNIVYQLHDLPLASLAGVLFPAPLAGMPPCVQDAPPERRFELPQITRI